MAIGALVGATALSSATNLASQGLNMAFNSKEAQKQRDWQERMSNTAYQRAVADMQKAGINPILAYSQGGASVGTGANASSSSPTSLSLPNSAFESKELKKLVLDSHNLQNDFMREQVHGKYLENLILEQTLSQKNNSRVGFR